MTSRHPHERSDRLCVVHVIVGLGLGGAEMVLTKLVEHTPDDVDVTVISLRGRGALADRIEAAGARVIAPDLRMRRSGPVALARLLRALEPDVVQTWMYHADLLAGTLARLTTRVPVVWGIHAGVLDDVGLGARVAIRTGAILSRVVPTRIACCSQTSMDVHRALGYDQGRMQLLDNGFEAAPDVPEARTAVRRELDLPDDALVVLRPGRWHPQKDYPNLLAAFGEVQRAGEDAALVLTGPRIDASEPELQDLVAALPDPSRVHLLGPRADADRLYAAADVVASSSRFGEAMPLIVGEAMAAGVPVVATDVGDSARLVGDTGWIVPAGDARGLAAALLAALRASSDERHARGQLARRRIIEHFSLERMTAGYLGLYRELAAAR